MSPRIPISLPLIVLLLLCLIPLASTLHAQDDPQSVISAALADFAALESYRFEAETSLNQDNTFGTASASTQTAQVIAGEMAGNATRADFAVTQTIDTGEPITWTVNVDRVAVDDAIYLRFRDLEITQEVSSEAFALPEGWFISEPLPQDMAILTSSQMGLLMFIDGYRSAPVVPPIVSYPLDDQTVRSVEQLPDEEIDGQSMRVYEVSFNAFGLYITHTREEWDATFLNFETSGIDIARFFVEGGLQVRGRFWIDGDGRLAQVEQQIRLEVRPGMIEGQDDYGFINDSRVQVAFSDYNMPLEIMPPEVESEI
jgi:hypothetical protein